jgi:hypothetical protein
VSALRADVLAVADGVTDEAAARSPGVWLAIETRTNAREVIRDQRLGARLRDRRPAVREAVQIRSRVLGAGRHHRPGLDRLPADLDPELVAKAEAYLVAEAGQFGPRELRRLGRRPWR